MRLYPKNAKFTLQVSYRFFGPQQYKLLRKKLKGHDLKSSYFLIKFVYLGITNDFKHFVCFWILTFVKILLNLNQKSMSS